MLLMNFLNAHHVVDSEKGNNVWAGQFKKSADEVLTIPSLVVSELAQFLGIHKTDGQTITESVQPLGNKNNLITKAYKLMRSHLNSSELEYSIQIKKNIPIGSGLGGGSSNAATTLTVLNKLWNMGFSNKKLEKLGLSLGADIPFFINGGLQLVEGIGEILSPQKNDLLRDLYFLLIIPSIYVSTKEAYSSLNKPLYNLSLTDPFTLFLFRSTIF